MERLLAASTFTALLLACSDDTGATDADRSDGGAHEASDDASAPDAGRPGADGGEGSDNTDGAAVWRPATGTTWQWQLTGSIDTTLDVAMYDIDLFDTPAATIAALHAEGRVVVCYFSAGTREDWRADAGDFQAADHGRGLPEWDGETWLDVRSRNVRAIMEKRMDLAVEKGCDGIEPDNVDAYQNQSGFPLSREDQLAYDRWLAEQAHARGLSVGLKNALELVAALEPSFDWALNEECLQFQECGELQPFVAANKAVFHAEYVDEARQLAAKRDQVCRAAAIAGFSTLVKTWDLGPEFFPCE